jgi:hypothetical protein
LILLAETFAVAQTNEKMIIRRLTILKEPLELSIRYNGHPLKAIEHVFPELGSRTLVFDGDSDWLKNLTFTLKNVSEKRITYVALFLIFPQTAQEKSSPGLNLPSPSATNRPRGSGLHRILIGVDPDKRLERPELRLAPGESVDVPLGPEFHDIATLVRLADHPIEQISQMEVQIHSALFDDDSLFEAGMMYRRDPKDPRRWVPIGSAPLAIKP